jgi:hypothetical protein
MHFTVFTSSTVPGRLVRLLVCALLPACASEATAGILTSSSRRHGNIPSLPSTHDTPPVPSTPYLLVCLPPPLRFAERVEPAARISSLAVAGAPLHPSGLIEEIASTNQQAALSGQPSVPATGVPVPGESPSTAATPAAPVDTVPAPVAGNPVVPAPDTGVSILPDDTPREIRAEDVLLYFRLPANSPSAGLPPPSSATYQQQ